MVWVYLTPPLLEILAPSLLPRPLHHSLLVPSRNKSQLRTIVWPTIASKSSQNQCFDPWYNNPVLSAVRKFIKICCLCPNRRCLVWIPFFFFFFDNHNRSLVWILNDGKTVTKFERPGHEGFPIDATREGS